MGNKLSRRRQVVDERYTRPQGLYQQKDVDHKKLRKLILDSKLAPCYPGDEECACDLEECPICFLYYPSLNRSRCCMKGICTECFLQMKTPNPTRPTQCPFCKSLNYAVEYRGMKTKEEKGLEQMEEQMVIEAKLRMQQQELEDEEDRMQKRHEISSSSRVIEPSMVECSPLTEGEDFVSSQYSSAASAIRQPLHSTNNRDDELDLDLEDIMVTEAIWLSIQENGRQRNPAYGDAAPLEQYITEDCSGLAVMSPLAETSSSPSGGLACAIHSFAEHQQMSRESSSKYNGNMSAFSLLPGCGRFSNIEEQVTEDHPPAGSLNEVSPDSAMAVDGREWGLNHGLEVVEEGTSYASSDAAEDEIEVSSDSRISALPPQDDIEVGFQTVIGTISSERFEEQMMLAMAISVAEA